MAVLFEILTRATLTRVLRLKEGCALEVCDGRGGLAAAELRGMTHNNRAYVEATQPVQQVFITPFRPLGASKEVVCN